MRIKSVSAGLAFLVVVLIPQPAHADWRDTFIRAVAPTLVNRGINYLLSRPRQKAPQQETSYYNPPPQQQYYDPPQQYYEPPAAPKKQVVSDTVPKQKPKSSGYVPPPPVIDRVDVKNPTTKKGNLEIPPPPKTMVPPPPPGVPTGAILGMFPEELNQLPAVQPTSNAPRVKPSPPKIEVDETPKVAPDFRRR
jgi:hypothetical protein